MNVIAVTEDGKVVLVRQYRHGTGEVTLEIPGGAVEKDDRSPLLAARRELLEETGFAAKRWRRLGVVHPNPAILSNACTTYLAEGARRVADPTPDAGEDLTVELVSLRALPGLVRSGAIRHSLVVAAFHFLSLAR